MHIALLILAVLVAYGPTLSYDFVWDDHDLIVDNLDVQQTFHWYRAFFRSFWELHHGVDETRRFYRPIIVVSYMVDYQLWGLDPRGFHLTNVLVYLLGVVLVYATSSALLERPWAALVAALIYALHPTHVENVAWISGRTDLFCALFYFASFWLIVSWTRRGCRGRWLVGSSLAAYALGLLSKEMAVTLPAVIAAYYWTRDRHTHPWRRLVAPLAGFGVTTAAYLGIRAFLLGEAVSASGYGSWTERLASMPMVLSKYVGLLALVTPADPHHPEGFVRGFLAPENLLYLVFTVACLALLLLLLRRKGVVAFSALWFVLSIAPVFNIGSFGDVLLADRFLNIPSFGWALLLTAGIMAAAGMPGPRGKLAWSALAVYLLVGFVLLGVNRRCWADNISLFSRAVETSPRSSYVHMHLGWSLLKAGKYEESLDAYDKAIELAPGNGFCRMGKGCVLERSGRLPEALRSFQEALGLGYRSYLVYFDIGNVLKRMGRFEPAIRSYEMSLELRRDYRALNNMGECYLALGRTDLARGLFLQSLAETPSRIVYNNLGVVAMKEENYPRATTYFSRAIDLDPDAISPHANLAYVKLAQGEPERARAFARKALELSEAERDPRRREAIVEAMRRILEAGTDPR